MTHYESMAQRYVDAREKDEIEEQEKFSSGVEGWYGKYYYKLIGGKMIAVDSINGDNSLNYPD